MASPHMGGAALIPLLMLGLLVVALSLIAFFSVLNLAKRLRKGQRLSLTQAVRAFLVPHFFLGTALLSALLFLPKSAIALQSAGIFALFVLLVAAAKGDAQFLVALFPPRRLLTVLGFLVALWGVAFYFMLSEESGRLMGLQERMESWQARSTLLPALISLALIVCWLSLLIAWKGRVKGIESAPRYEGIWRTKDDGLALDVGEETHPVQLGKTHLLDEALRSGERCVLFAAPVRKGDGPFRGGTTLVASHVVAGSWDAYRRSLRDGLYCLHILAVAGLWGLAFSAAELIAITLR